MESDLYVEMDRSEYDSIEALNQSTIKTAYEKSLLHAQHSLLYQKAPTDDMMIGQAIHTLMLEPKLFNKRFAPMPVNDKGVRWSRASTEGRVQWELWDEEHAGKYPIKLAQYEELKKIREAILSHPTARAMLDAAEYKEVSFFWDHPTYQFPCKGQADLLTQYKGWTWAGDLKSTQDASPEGFAREIAKYSYFVQDRWYLEGLNAIAEADRRFAFIAFEKKPPYAVGVYEIDAESALEGQFRCDTIAKRWSHALETGEFEGYPVGINTPRAMRWAMTHEYAFDQEDEFE